MKKKKRKKKKKNLITKTRTALHICGSIWFSFTYSFFKIFESVLFDLQTEPNRIVITPRDFNGFIEGSSLFFFSSSFDE